jgi:CD109 antigen
LFTPRLRQYFPETLVWRPEVITDKHGHAHIHFPTADNITSWKMSVIASTESGQVGLAEKELRSFQPFFIEHDPPKVLTEGDRISLPVVLRNYTDQPLTVLTELQPASWFTILSAPKQSVIVAPNDDANSVSTFRADSSARNAKQRVTARNGTTGDAVERELTVHPNGQEISFSTSRLLAGARDSLEIRVPDNSIRGSVDAELRLYPNLMAHVLDAMRGIGARPTGCAEQITSSAYVSLMALKLLKKAGQDQPGSSNPRSAIATQARTALQEAYDQLITLQNPDGGFTYWHPGPSNIALTAYVLRFLNAAQEFIDVNGSIPLKARNYLITQQAKSGAWTSYHWDVRKEMDDANWTAYVARSLAGTKGDVKGKDEQKERQKAEASIKLALDYLEAQIDSWSDAYLAGNYAIVAIDSGRPEHIDNARSLLHRLAHREGDTMYWNLEANTSPFFGWGTAGRLETTALAVEALAMLQASHPHAQGPLRDVVFNASHAERAGSDDSGSAVGSRGGRSIRGHDHRQRPRGSHRKTP